MDIPSIMEFQREFNDIMSEHEELNSSRSQCDGPGEQECLNEMRDLGIRAMNAQAKIKELMKSES